MSNVSNFDGITNADLKPDRVIEAAQGDCPGGVVICGYDADGEYYFASSLGSAEETLWLLEACKRQLLDDTDMTKGNP